MASFKKLGLSKPILKVLSELEFEKPTEIQAESIPYLIDGLTDFIGIAQTGTGKTAAFGLPALEQIDPSAEFTQVLVLAPTRELGQQIAEQLKIFSKYMDRVNVLPVYGGAAISNQIKALKKTQHVIIATPGRLIDLIKRKAVKLDRLRFLILDEADEMLNMGFKEEIDKILKYTPEEKFTWLFSATMPSAIKRIVKKYMDEPIEVKVNVNQEVNENISHQYILVKQSDKMEALTRFIDLQPEMRGVVFCRTKRDTQNLAEKLLKNSYKADAIHGDLSQAQRDRVMKRFKSTELPILIATDVAARGIDVNDLSHVFHFTLPDDMSYYTHRSGRTARAGKKGISMAFLNGREGYKIRKIEKQLDIQFKEVKIPDAKDIASIRVENWCRKVLEKKTKGRVDEELFEKAEMLFGNLSKEELILKLLAMELSKLSSGEARDLNDKKQKDKRDTRGDRRGSSRNYNRKKDRGRGPRNFKKKGRRSNDDQKKDRAKSTDEKKGKRKKSGKKKKRY